MSIIILEILSSTGTLDLVHLVLHKIKTASKPSSFDKSTEEKNLNLSFY